MGKEMSIHIRIGEEWVITSDQHQFILNQIAVRGSESKSAGEEYMKPVGYYHNIRLLIDGLIKRSVKTADLDSLECMSNEIERVSELFQKAFDEVFK